MNNKINCNKIEKELKLFAILQDRYDFETINLIAPACVIPFKYYENISLKHYNIAEGLLEKRMYAGLKYFNKIEYNVAKLAKYIFKAEHANVQPHSVSQANQAVYQALLSNQDKVLAMKFTAGGHLTHGMKKNFSGRFFDFSFYGLDKNGFINYKELEEKALREKPKLIVCGASSYPREIDFKKLHNISKKVGAYLMADLSHPAGLIAVNKFPQPFPYCDVVTLTLDKTMLGTHGGIILCKKYLKDVIDSAVHPGVQSSIPLRRIYEMGLCLVDATKPRFKNYIERMIANMKMLEKKLKKYSGLMVTGGTDSNLIVLDTFSVFGLTGEQSESLLESLGILTNRQVIPGEQFKPSIASGIRLGAAWITGRGYSRNEVGIIADIILNNLKDPKNIILQEKSKKIVKNLISKRRKNDVWSQ